MDTEVIEEAAESSDNDKENYDPGRSELSEDSMSDSDSTTARREALLNESSENVRGQCWEAEDDEGCGNEQRDGEPSDDSDTPNTSSAPKSANFTSFNYTFEKKEYLDEPLVWNERWGALTEEEVRALEKRYDDPPLFSTTFLTTLQIAKLLDGRLRDCYRERDFPKNTIAENKTPSFLILRQIEQAVYLVRATEKNIKDATYGKFSYDELGVGNRQKKGNYVFIIGQNNGFSDPKTTQRVVQRPKNLPAGSSVLRLRKKVCVGDKILREVYTLECPGSDYRSPFLVMQAQWAEGITPHVWTNKPHGTALRHASVPFSSKSKQRRVHDKSPEPFHRTRPTVQGELVDKARHTPASTVLAEHVRAAGGVLELESGSVASRKRVQNSLAIKRKSEGWSHISTTGPRTIINIRDILNACEDTKDFIILNQIKADSNSPLGLCILMGSEQSALDFRRCVIKEAGSAL